MFFKSFPKSIRIISLLLAVSFLCEQGAFGSTTLTTRAANSHKTMGLGFELPESVATIEDWSVVSRESWVVSKDRKDSSPTTHPSRLIYLIQDAHTNTSGQINLAKTLDLILKHNDKINSNNQGSKLTTHDSSLTTVFLEAGFKDESLSFLKQYGTKEKRNQIAQRFLKRGDLQGEEYLSITSGQDFVLWGVEDPSLYKESLEKYKLVSKNRPKYQDYLNKIDQTIQVLKSRIYNPLLLSLDESRIQYNKGNISITQYLKKLMDHQSPRIPSAPYPHLKNLKKLQKLEQVLERQKQRYPKLSVLNHYKKLSSSLKAKEVLKELDSLEKEAFDSLLTTQDEKQLFQASKTLDYLKKLLNLSITPEEYKDYQALKLNITSLTGFLNKKIMDLKSYYENALFLEEGFEDTIQSSEDFYDLTLKRDQKFIENMLSVVTHDQPAVLITGGYHTPNLKKLLKEKNISYIVLTPAITHETSQKRYENLLIGSKDLSLSPNSTKIHLNSSSTVTMVDILPLNSASKNPFDSRFHVLPQIFDDLSEGKGNHKSQMPRTDTEILGTRLATADRLKQYLLRNKLTRKISRDISMEKLSKLLGEQTLNDEIVQNILGEIKSEKKQRAKIIEMVKDVKSQDKISRREFLDKLKRKALFFSGLPAIIMSAIFYYKFLKTKEDPLIFWRTYKSKPTLENMQKVIQLTGEWLRVNGYPHMDVIDHYVKYVVSNQAKEATVTNLPGAPAGKAFVKGSARITIYLNPLLLNDIFLQVQAAESESLFVETLAALVVREAWGTLALESYPDWFEEIVQENNLLERKFKNNFGIQQNERSINDFFYSHRETVRKMVAMHFSFEFFETLHQMDFMNWAASKTLFSNQEARSAFAKSSKKTPLFSMWRQQSEGRYSQSQDPRSLFDEDFSGYVRLILDLIREGQTKDLMAGPAISFRNYYATEEWAYTKTNHIEGIEPSLARSLLAGENIKISSVLSRQFDQIYSLVEKIVKDRTLLIEKKRKEFGGARLAEDDDFIIKTANFLDKVISKALFDTTVGRQILTHLIPIASFGVLINPTYILIPAFYSIPWNITLLATEVMTVPARTKRFFSKDQANSGARMAGEEIASGASAFSSARKDRWLRSSNREPSWQRWHFPLSFTPSFWREQTTNPSQILPQKAPTKPIGLSNFFAQKNWMRSGLQRGFLPNPKQLFPPPPGVLSETWISTPFLLGLIITKNKLEVNNYLYKKQIIPSWEKIGPSLEVGKWNKKESGARLASKKKKKEIRGQNNVPANLEKTPHLSAWKMVLLTGFMGFSAILMGVSAVLFKRIAVLEKKYEQRLEAVELLEEQNRLLKEGAKGLVEAIKAYQDKWVAQEEEIKNQKEIFHEMNQEMQRLKLELQTSVEGLANQRNNESREAEEKIKQLEEQINGLKKRIEQLESIIRSLKPEMKQEALDPKMVNDWDWSFEANMSDSQIEKVLQFVQRVRGVNGKDTLLKEVRKMFEGDDALLAFLEILICGDHYTLGDFTENIQKDGKKRGIFLRRFFAVHLGGNLHDLTLQDYERYAKASLLISPDAKIFKLLIDFRNTLSSEISTSVREKILYLMNAHFAPAGVFLRYHEVSSKDGNPIPIVNIYFTPSSNLRLFKSEKGEFLFMPASDNMTQIKEDMSSRGFFIYVPNIGIVVIDEKLVEVTAAIIYDHVSRDDAETFFKNTIEQYLEPSKRLSSEKELSPLFSVLNLLAKKSFSGKNLEQITKAIRYSTFFNELTHATNHLLGYRPENMSKKREELSSDLVSLITGIKEGGQHYFLSEKAVNMICEWGAGKESDYIFQEKQLFDLLYETQRQLLKEKGKDLPPISLEGTNDFSEKIVTLTEMLQAFLECSEEDLATIAHRSFLEKFRREPPLSEINSLESTRPLTEIFSEDSQPDFQENSEEELPSAPSLFHKLLSIKDMNAFHSARNDIMKLDIDGKKEMISLVIKNLQDLKDSHDLGKIYWIIKTVGPPASLEAVPILIQILKNPTFDSHVREWVFDALIEIGSPTDLIIDAFIEQLSNKNKKEIILHRKIIEALGRMGKSARFSTQAILSTLKVEYWNGESWAIEYNFNSYRKLVLEALQKIDPDHVYDLPEWEEISKDFHDKGKKNKASEDGLELDDFELHSITDQVFLLEDKNVDDKGRMDILQALERNIEGILKSRLVAEIVKKALEELIAKEKNQEVLDLAHKLLEKIGARLVVMENQNPSNVQILDLTPQAEASLKAFVANAGRRGRLAFNFNGTFVFDLQDELKDNGRIERSLVYRGRVVIFIPDLVKERGRLNQEFSKEEQSLMEVRGAASLVKVLAKDARRVLGPAKVGRRVGVVEIDLVGLKEVANQWKQEGVLEGFLDLFLSMDSFYYFSHLDGLTKKEQKAVVDKIALSKKATLWRPKDKLIAKINFTDKDKLTFPELLPGELVLSLDKKGLPNVLAVWVAQELLSVYSAHLTSDGRIPEPQDPEYQELLQVLQNSRLQQLIQDFSKTARKPLPKDLHEFFTAQNHDPSLVLKSILEVLDDALAALRQIHQTVDLSA